jgi:hypothetical protein
VENLFILYIVVAQVFYIKRVIKSPSKHVTLLLEMALVCPYDLSQSIKVKLTDSTGNRFYMEDWMDKPKQINVEQHSLIVKSFVFDWGN